MSNLVSVQQPLIELLSKYPNAKRWVIAYSGGLDSTVLLHAANAVIDAAQSQSSVQSLPCVVALHINHGLSDQALDWQEHCTNVAQSYALTCHSIAVNIDYTGKGPEASARKARYRAFESFLEQDDILLQAHHADDQLETFFLRLMRGAGLKGLGAMPVQRKIADAILFRPFLYIDQITLQQYAQQAELMWVEDKSNEDVSFDRNFIRHHITPAFLTRWPHAKQSIQKSLHWLAETHELCDELGQQDLISCRHQVDRWGSQSIDLDAYKVLSTVRKKNLLRTWLETNYEIKLKAKQLALIVEESFSKLILARSSNKTMVVEVFANRMYCYSQIAEQHLSALQEKKIQLPTNQRVEIPFVGAIQLITDKQYDDNFYVSFRQGGERCRPLNREKSQQLKKLLQEKNIPRWWRQRVPLIYWKQTLIAVGDLWKEQLDDNIIEQIDIVWQPCKYQKNIDQLVE